MVDQAREAILARVRQALKNPSPEPHWLHEPAGEGPVFPLPDATESALRQRFSDEFTAIQGEWLQADSLDAGKTLLADWLSTNKIGSAIAADSPALRFVLSAVGQHGASVQPAIESSGSRQTSGVRRAPNSGEFGYGVEGFQPAISESPQPENPSTNGAIITWVDSKSVGHEGWENFDLGITLAESLVTESGTIVVSAALSGRALSVLPPIHLVIATADQLVPDLDTAIARLRKRYPDRLPSSFSFISGPSRTADIEKILVLGAHGPKRLAVLLLPSG